MLVARLLLAAAATLVAVVLVLPALALGLAFWAVGPLTHLWRRALRPQLLRWQDVIAYEPVVGWKPRPSVRGFGAVHRNGRLVDQFRLSTDAEGWRAGPSLAESDVVVFGDSFAFGHATDDGHCFQHVLREPRIKAIGANGYNMVQELLWMRRYAPQLAGKLVVWFVYHGNDLFDNLQPNVFQYRTPFVRERRHGEGWEIVTDHVKQAPWVLTVTRRDAARLAEICSPTALAERAFGACEWLFGEAEELCREAGARLVVMTIPERIQIDPSRHHVLLSRAPDAERCDVWRPDQRLRTACERQGIPFVPLHDHLTIADYLHHDVHWNGQGHRKVAELLRHLHGDLRPHARQRPRPRAPQPSPVSVLAH